MTFCRGSLYARCRWLLRKKQSKGHGVHSPFAFDLITNVIYSPYSFYAFSDIPEILSKNGLDPYLIGRINHFSFRLVYYLKPKDILEVNTGIGVNSLFLTAPSPYIHCTCVEEDRNKVEVTGRLQEEAGRKCKMVPSLADCRGEHYDAIFIYLKDRDIPDISVLSEMSKPATFWVFYPINRGSAKQFWNEIVHDVNARMTFDLKDTGVVFLRKDFGKANYFV